MRKTATITVLIVVFAVSVVWSEESSDFRNVRFGMSMDDVESIEGKPDQIEDNIMAYEVSINGINMLLAYRFIEDQMVRAVYINVEDYMDNKHYVDDYKKLMEMVSKVYGTPATSEIQYDDDMLSGFYSDKTAFQLGMVSFYAEWELERFTIQHVLRSEPQGGMMGILDGGDHRMVYESTLVDHVELMDAKRLKELKEQL